MCVLQCPPDIFEKNATFAPSGPPSETSWHKVMLRTKNVWESNWSCDDGFWGTTPLGTSSGCSLVVMLLATCFRPESLRFNTAAFNKKVDVEVSYKAISPNYIKGQSSETWSECNRIHSNRLRKQLITPSVAVFGTKTHKFFCDKVMMWWDTLHHQKWQQLLLEAPMAHVHSLPSPRIWS